MVPRTPTLAWVQRISIGRPMAPLSIWVRSTSCSGSNSRMKPTWTSRRPVAASVSMTSWASWVVSATGFSTKTRLPASMHAMAKSACVWSGDAMTIPSIDGSAIRRYGSSVTADAGPATSDARARSTSVMVTSMSSIERRFSIWRAPIPPAPMTPMCISGPDYCTKRASRKAIGTSSRSRAPVTSKVESSGVRETGHVRGAVDDAEGVWSTVDGIAGSGRPEPRIGPVASPPGLPPIEMRGLG